MNKDIDFLLDEIIIELMSDSRRKSPVKCFEKGIPTLEKDFYRPVTPMLRARFEKIGGWEDATHGDWLDPYEMSLFWSDNISDERIACINLNIKASINNWINDVGGLFKDNRLSIFAGSAYSFERIYLIWFDDKDEPEVWVYDSNGEGRYSNLSEYLEAYINDDLSAYEKKWIL